MLSGKIIVATIDSTALTIYVFTQSPLNFHALLPSEKLSLKWVPVSLSKVKRQGVALTTHPHLAARLKKE
jgi:hypothetical protein